MKRGLVAAPGDDAPVFQARLERLRGRLRAAGAAVGLIYGDVYRSDDIAHLTNLCIYWNEGVLAVPVDGAPALLAKLSARVHGWMRRTSVLDDLRASQKLPELVGEYTAEQPPGAVAFVDESWWPADLVRGIRAAVADRALVDLPDAVRADRLTADDRDREDLQHAGAIAAEALAAARAAGEEVAPAHRTAAMERCARAAGARDLIAACHARQDGATQIELTVQFANVWTAAARVLNAAPAAEASLRELSDALAPGVTLADLRRRHGSATLVHHCDLASAGDYRPDADGAVEVPAGATVYLAVGGADGVVGDTFSVHGGGATLLTGSTLTGYTMAVPE